MPRVTPATTSPIMARPRRWLAVKLASAKRQIWQWQRILSEISPGRATRRRTDLGRPKPDRSCATDTFRTFDYPFFRKIEFCTILVPMDATDIGNARPAAGAVGEARPGAYAEAVPGSNPGIPGHPGGLCPGNGAVKAFSTGFRSNPLKSLNSRKKMGLVFVPNNLEFVPPNLDFVPSGLDFVPSGLDFVPAGLEPLPCGPEGRPRLGRPSVLPQNRRLVPGRLRGARPGGTRPQGRGRADAMEKAPQVSGIARNGDGTARRPQPESAADRTLGGLINRRQKRPRCAGPPCPTFRPKRRRRRNRHVRFPVPPRRRDRPTVASRTSGSALPRSTIGSGGRGRGCVQRRRSWLSERRRTAERLERPRDMLGGEARVGRKSDEKRFVREKILEN